MGEENKATFSMQQVKEILKMHEETVFGFIKLTVERFDTKLDKLTHEIHGINRDIVDLKESANFSTSQVQDVEKFFAKIEEMIKKIGPIFPADLQKKIETNFMEHAEMKKQLINLEDRGRRNNLRINGIEEIEGETNESLEEDIKALFKEKLGITKNITIERIHRSGSKSYRDGNINIKRIIVLKCLNFKDKELVLKSYIEKKLWHDKIYVNEDFSEKNKHLTLEQICFVQQKIYEHKVIMLKSLTTV